MNKAGRLTVVATLALALGCSSSEPQATGTDSGEDSGQLAVADPESPQTISGGGQFSSDPFRLKGGRYTVHYKLGSDCSYFADLEPVNGDYRLTESLAIGAGPIDGDSNLYDVDAGEYYVQMITGPDPNCPWEITLTGG